MSKNVVVRKKDVLAAVASLVKEDVQVQVNDVVVTGADIKAYVDTTLAQLANKAEKAKERAAEKRVKGDELRDAIQAVLTDEYQTIAEITAQVDGEEVTPAKVSVRLAALVKQNLAHKTKVKNENSNSKINAYAAGPAPVDEAE